MQQWPVSVLIWQIEEGIELVRPAAPNGPTSKASRGHPASERLPAAAGKPVCAGSCDPRLRRALPFPGNLMGTEGSGAFQRHELTLRL